MTSERQKEARRRRYRRANAAHSETPPHADSEALAKPRSGLTLKYNTTSAPPVNADSVIARWRDGDGPEPVDNCQRDKNL